MSIRVGVIGAGVMGLSHISTIHDSVAGAKVTMVCDPDPGRAQEASRRADGAPVATDPEQLIASSSVDAVLVASPDSTHASYVTTCLSSGKPVLCEKPLAETAAACLDLRRREAQTGRQLVQVGFMRRFDPAYVDLKTAYESDAVGPALLVRCIHRNAAAPAFFSGNMAITNAMVHEFDIVRWLTGSEIRRVRVSGPPGATGASSGDPLLAVLETDGGQIVDIEVYMNASYGYDIRTEIVGRRGTLEMAGRSTTARRVSGGETFSHCRDFTERFAEAYCRQLQDWTNALILGRGVGLGANTWDGYVAVQVAEAAVQALRSQDWVEVILDSQSEISHPTGIVRAG